VSGREAKSSYHHTSARRFPYRVLPGHEFFIAAWQYTDSLSEWQYRTCSNGQIVTLLANDSQKFYELMPLANLVWAAPLQIAIATYFLIAFLGMSRGIYTPPPPTPGCRVHAPHVVKLNWTHSLLIPEEPSPFSNIKAVRV
jgi:hypothetical protein